MGVVRGRFSASPCLLLLLFLLSLSGGSRGSRGRENTFGEELVEVKGGVLTEEAIVFDFNALERRWKADRYPFPSIRNKACNLPAAQAVKPHLIPLGIIQLYITGPSDP